MGSAWLTRLTPSPCPFESSPPAARVRSMSTTSLQAPNEMDQARKAERRRGKVFWLTLAVLVFANVYAYCVRLASGVALSPWEPAIVMEAVRFNLGLPVYASTHATHMYGPLFTVAIGETIRLTGVGLSGIRAVFSCFGLLLPGVLAGVICGWRDRWRWLAAFILFWAVNLRTDFIFMGRKPTAQRRCWRSSAWWLGTRARTLGRHASLAWLYFWLAFYSSRPARRSRSFSPCRRCSGSQGRPAASP